MKRLLKTVFVLLIFSATIFSQVTADLTIENQQAVGTDFFFDIYLTRTGTEDLYLGNADLVLTFTASNFNSPVLANEAVEYCTFVPTISNPTNNLFTQDFYFNNTSVVILNGNELAINLNGPTPSTQTNFDTRVARIDNTPSTHRLGRFRVSGIINPNGFMNLQWKTTGTGVTTQVFTLAPVSPWISSAVNINAINPGNAPLPVELTSFTAAFKNSEVLLSWKTKTEVNNYGFNVERRINESEWNSIGFVKGHGNSNSPKEYSYSDKELFAGGSKFQYRLKQIDTDGSFEYSDIVEVEVVPDQYELSQNYPNPFNPSTTIRFSLPQAVQIKINLYNMLGEQVKTLAEGTYEVGYHKIVVDAANLPSGTYVYRLESSDFVQVKKMILIK